MMRFQRGRIFIAIEAEPLLNGGWQPQWFAKMDGKVVRHTSSRSFIDKQEADNYAKRSALRKIGKFG